MKRRHHLSKWRSTGKLLPPTEKVAGGRRCGEWMASSSLGAATDFHCPSCLAAVFTAPKTYLLSTQAALAGTDQCRDCRSWPGKDRSERRGGQNLWHRQPDGASCNYGICAMFHMHNDEQQQRRLFIFTIRTPQEVKAFTAVLLNSLLQSISSLRG